MGAYQRKAQMMSLRVTESATWLLGLMLFASWVVLVRGIERGDYRESKEECCLQVTWDDGT